MRCLERNKRSLWHASIESREVIDEPSGMGTGEWAEQISDPVYFRANASAPKGDTTSSPFGLEAGYELVVVLDDAQGIKEGDIIWVSDKKPSATDRENAYTVVRVSRSLNYTALGLARRQGA
ncbi:hypothetical protein K6V98_08320 [Collinsella sp. AGMB00827]|uniref:Head-tail adaptor protein n=1 Tax=Collinsella ureilytica TaxID=2869515 RepID=A0ABS7MLW5_9ACTN|nr:hypothetical protein [Collinsella urealyticum]MBY4798349.1 hypothetical protein [Collinsella urealyticum]